MRELLKSLLVTLVTLVVALPCAEAAFRAVSGKTVFALTQYRAANIVYNEFPKNLISYDPLLGWRMNAGVSYPTPEQIRQQVRAHRVHTIDFGVRRNNSADDHLRTGGVLVTGASFTLGSEVNDEDAWPAQLETLVGRPILNGAVGGFGVDQIIMRAEQLLPIVKPQVVIIDLVPENIGIAGYSYNGYPKPYFMIESGRLVLHNNPVPPYQPRINTFEPLKDLLSYSFMIDRIMATYFADTWYSSRTQNFTRADNDDVKVSCLLLSRLKKETDDAGARLIVTVQYGGGTIESTQRPDGSALLVEDCVRRMGIQFVDEFASLKAFWQSDPDKFKSLYVARADGTLGHKSRAGNFEWASRVAAALALPTPASTSSELAADQESSKPQASGEVLLSNDAISALFQTSLADARIETKGALSDAPTHRLVANGKPGEHYLVLSVGDSTGTLTFSVEASADTSSNLRLQLYCRQADGAQDGVFGIFDLGRATAETWRLGRGTNIGAVIQPIGDHWYKLWVTATLPPSERGQNQVVIELANTQGKYSFTPDGEAVKIRNVTLQRGSTPAKRQ